MCLFTIVIALVITTVIIKILMNVTNHFGTHSGNALCQKWLERSSALDYIFLDIRKNYGNLKGVVTVSSIIPVVDKLEIVKSNIKEIDELVKSHIESLSYPMDSWLEDRLLESDIYNLMFESNCIGYAGLIKDTLQFFYVRKDCFRYAPVILEKIVSEKAIKRVYRKPLSGRF